MPGRVLLPVNKPRSAVKHYVHKTTGTSQSTGEFSHEFWRWILDQAPGEEDIKSPGQNF